MDPALGILSPEEVAELVGMHPVTIRRALNDKKLKGFKMSGSQYWYVRREEIDAWLSREEAA